MNTRTCPGCGETFDQRSIGDGFAVRPLYTDQAEVLAILREAESDRIEARSAILEFDAYLSRRESERRARNEQHPANGGNAA